MMDRQALQALLPFLYNHPVRGQSDARVEALTRMYLAINDAICVLCFRDTEKRRNVIRKIDALYKAIDNTSIRGLRQMYRLTKEVTLAVYGKKDGVCRRLYDELIGKKRECPEPAVEIDTMQCIVYEFGNVIGGNTQSDDYAWFRKRCEHWISETDDSGYWPGLPEETALHRLALLQDNSFIFNDKSLDAAALRIYASYRSRMAMPARLTAEELPLSGAWYDLLKMAALYPREPMLERRITALQEEFAASATPRTDAWYTVVGYLVEQSCTGIEEQQLQMLQAIG